MKITREEQVEIRAVIDAGKRFGYGNLISHLRTAWARYVMDDLGVSEDYARLASGGPGIPFAMQDDIVERGEWDETGEKYRK